MVTAMENYKLDLRMSRLHVDSSPTLKKFYSGGAYYEVQSDKIKSDFKPESKKRRKILNDYLFTALPFIAAERDLEMKLLDNEKINGVNYFVLEMKFKEKDPMIHDTEYLLYIACSIHRLEKVFYKAGKGTYIWCEYDNFSRVDGMLLSMHRKFTYASDSDGNKKGGPFLEEWLKDATLEGSINDDLFSIVQ